MKRVLKFGFAALVAGCGAEGGAMLDETQGEPGAEESIAAADQQGAQSEDSPAELTIDGTRFVRADLLAESDVAELTDPSLWEEPQTLDKLATNLRKHMLHMEYGAYVEAEPNYALARISLGLDAPPETELQGGGAGPREGRVISSNGDQRGTAEGGTVEGAVAMFETSGSGSWISSGSAASVYTAGHVVYNNATNSGSDGWYCRNGTVQATLGNCSQHARWAFGGRGDSWVAGFRICGYRYVPNGWANMPSGTSGGDATRWDYGMQNLDGCRPNVNSFGWSVQNTLSGKTMYNGGYPGLYPCPADSSGAPGAGGDCPGGTAQVTPTNFSRPFTQGQLYFSNGTQQDSGTGWWAFNIDSTQGHSGGPSYYWENNWIYVAGAVSRKKSYGVTYYNRYTWEVHEFLGF